MTTKLPFSLTADERGRIEHIDRLIVSGAAGVAELIETMSDPSWTVRRASVAALAAAGDDAVGPLCHWLTNARTSEHAIAAAVDALVASIGGSTDAAVTRLLANPLPAVVADGLQILGRRHALAAAPAIIPLLAHADDNVALAAIDALGATGDAASIEPLIALLASGNFFRTFAVLQVLPKSGDPRAIAPIAALLAQDTYRLEAISALGRTGAVQAIAPLAGELTRVPSDALIRPLARAFADLLARAEWTGAAESAIGEMRALVTPSLARFTAALRGADAADRAALAILLGRIGDASVLPELAHLLDDPALADSATAALQRITKTSNAAMLAALASSDPALRVAVLPVVNTTDASAPLQRLLADTSAEVRARACAALARIGDTSAVGALFDVLADSNLRVAHAAAAAIQSLGAADTEPRAIAALATGSASLRRQVLRIIAYLGSRDAFDAVRAAADDADRAIAELAVVALAALEDPRVPAALVELTRSPREHLRAAAMRAITQRASTDAVGLLEQGLSDEAAWVRYYACQGLGRLAHAGSADHLIAHLVDPAPQVRIAALEALARLDTPAAADALYAAVSSLEVDERRAALVGIGQHVRPAGLAVLLAAEASDDEATRLIALSGLARRPEPAALAALAAAAGGDDVAIRDAALSLLVERDDRAAANAIIDLALDAEPGHPAHLALSQPSPARVAALVERLGHADGRALLTLVAALGRMRTDAATSALFAALELPNPTVRRIAASTLIAVAAPGARERVSRLAATDPDPEVRRACNAATVADPS